MKLGLSVGIFAPTDSSHLSSFVASSFAISPRSSASTTLVGMDFGRLHGLDEATLQSLVAYLMQLPEELKKTN